MCAAAAIASKKAEREVGGVVRVSGEKGRERGGAGVHRQQLGQAARAARRQQEARESPRHCARGDATRRDAAARHGRAGQVGSGRGGAL